MIDFKILNIRGIVIGSATAENARAAVVAWNKANNVSTEFAVEAVPVNDPATKEPHEDQQQ